MKYILTLALLFATPAYAADEVVVSERIWPSVTVSGEHAPVLGNRVTTQVIDIATESAAFNSNTNMIRICNNAGAAIWYKIGASGVSAAANTDGNEYLLSGQCVDETLSPTDTNIDTAADS